MKKFVLILCLLLSLYNNRAFAQENVNFSWGPVINLSKGFYDNNNLSGSFNPSFGIAFQNHFEYFLSFKAAVMYSYKSVGNIYGDSSRLGQFIDIPIGLKFSDYYESEKLLKPYISVNYVSSIKISETTDDEKLLKTYIPGFNINIGTQIKMVSFFSHADISLGYYRAFSDIYSNKKYSSTLNQFTINLGFWF
ncbi:MAG: hypothetical protein ACOYO1_19015 [Bacteroidales bacterium]